MRYAKSRRLRCGYGQKAKSRKPACGSVKSRGLICVLPAEDAKYGHENYLQVHPERPIADIGEVVLDALFHLLERVSFATPAVHLGPAGDARLHLVAEHVTLDERA